MAIKNERLEELIKEGAFIFYIYNEKSIGIIKLDKSYGISVDKYNEINKCKPVFYHKGNVYQDICDADKIFETKKQAEWALKYHAVRIETLDLPTWEEFTSMDNSIIRFYVRERNYSMYIFVKNKKTNNCRILIRVDNGEQDWLVFEEPATEENYEKACDLCLKLFKGEEK